MPKKKPLSKYGLPKNFTVTAYSSRFPPEAVKWGEVRDALDGELMDVLDAFEAGIIDRKTYSAERALIVLQLKDALRKYDAALRARGPASTGKGRKKKSIREN
jgi:hypothetical protein